MSIFQGNSCTYSLTNCTCRLTDLLTDWLTGVSQANCQTDRQIMLNKYHSTIFLHLLFIVVYFSIFVNGNADLPWCYVIAVWFFPTFFSVVLAHWASRVCSIKSSWVIVFTFKFVFTAEMKVLYPRAFPPICPVKSHHGQPHQQIIIMRQ